MRLGYGYRRSAEDFHAAFADRVWIDDAASERRQLGILLRDALRPGDTVILLASEDLGDAGEIAAATSAIEGAGGIIEIAGIRPTRAPGKKPRFTPGPEKEREIRRIWRDTRYSGVYALALIRQAAGFQGSDRALRNALNYRFGGRGAGRSKPRE